MLKNFQRQPLCLFLIIFLITISLGSSLPAAETELAGFTEERIDEIKKAIEPVLKGQPVTDIPEEDRQLLFLAEMIYSDSFDLFLRHGEYLAEVKRDYTQAIPRLKRAYELKPKEIKILEKLAECHQALKQEANEVSCWETLRELLENEESDQDTEKRDLRERVMVNLDRMARENAMMMRAGRRFIIYTPVESAYTYVTHELIDDRLEEIGRASCRERV